MLPFIALLWATTTSPISPEIATTSPVVASSVETCISLPKELIYAKITQYAQEYGVSESMMDYVVRHESRYDNCAVGDTHLIDPDGNPHVSKGAVQINEYWNPKISESEALDIDFSLKFLASNLADGKCRLWTTCRAFKKIHSLDKI